MIPRRRRVGQGTASPLRPARDDPDKNPDKSSKTFKRKVAKVKPKGKSAPKKTKNSTGAKRTEVEPEENEIHREEPELSSSANASKSALANASPSTQLYNELHGRASALDASSSTADPSIDVNSLRVKPRVEVSETEGHACIRLYEYTDALSAQHESSAELASFQTPTPAIHARAQAVATGSIATTIRVACGKTYEVGSDVAEKVAGSVARPATSSTLGAYGARTIVHMWHELPVAREATYVEKTRPQSVYAIDTAAFQNFIASLAPEQVELICTTGHEPVINNHHASNSKRKHLVDISDEEDNLSKRIKTTIATKQRYDENGGAIVPGQEIDREIEIEREADSESDGSPVILPHELIEQSKARSKQVLKSAEEDNMQNDKSIFNDNRNTQPVPTTTNRNTFTPRRPVTSGWNFGFSSISKGVGSMGRIFKFGGRSHTTATETPTRSMYGTSRNTDDFTSTSTQSQDNVDSISVQPQVAIPATSSQPHIDNNSYNSQHSESSNASASAAVEQAPVALDNGQVTVMQMTPQNDTAPQTGTSTSQLKHQIDLIMQDFDDEDEKQQAASLFLHYKENSADLIKEKVKQLMDDRKKRKFDDADLDANQSQRAVGMQSNKKKKLNFIPQPPGVSYGLNEEYVYASDSDEENQDKTHIESASQASKVVGSPDRATPYTGKMFADAKQNVFAQSIQHTESFHESKTWTVPDAPSDDDDDDDPYDDPTLLLSSQEKLLSERQRSKLIQERFACLPPRGDVVNVARTSLTPALDPVATQRAAAMKHSPKKGTNLSAMSRRMTNSPVASPSQTPAAQIHVSTPFHSLVEQTAQNTIQVPASSATSRFDAPRAAINTTSPQIAIVKSIAQSVPQAPKQAVIPGVTVQSSTVAHSTNTGGSVENPFGKILQEMSLNDSNLTPAQRSIKQRIVEDVSFALPNFHPTVMAEVKKINISKIPAIGFPNALAHDDFSNVSPAIMDALTSNWGPADEARAITNFKNGISQLKAASFNP
jgi:hypothetical protein